MDVLILSEGNHSLQRIGDADDRGCVRCRGRAIEHMPGVLVVDDRGRYWHARCAAITLAEFTRYQEERGASFHYERKFLVEG